MKLIIVKDNIEGAQKGFEIIEDAYKSNTLHTMGLATGSTPLTLYKRMVESDLDFSTVTSVNLDEYVGLTGDHPQSYRYFMEQNLFQYKPFKATYVPDGSNDNEQAVSDEYEAIIAAHPIDIQILGIGGNGHIGFNEPGSSFDSITRKVELKEETIEANARFFDSIDEVPTFAYSMGIKDILSAKKVLLFAYGEQKADAIRRLFEEDKTTDLPASALKDHSDVIVIVDEKAASALTQ
ncbi:glucosamine-6-phosphate deaminase [Erysipelothrix larvae]|uniref:Glucosamine-6-phosphate deaminase n=1 Tax=Erysipelothrix larvae TaxID=1514105 RepID=A0A0X8GZZ0_9FIRM|nr:glucosamine-6-phosphate deaminase [Erysipelothrix larvae]AMC93521.1 glucosamine-6-phosphate deaminase [Erysipelothrix larvae]